LGFVPELVPLGLASNRRLHRFIQYLFGHAFTNRAAQVDRMFPTEAQIEASVDSEPYPITRGTKML
jgi:hypothetical protein